MQATHPLAPGQVLVEADRIGFGYARHRTLDDVSLVVRSGEFVALVGPNGSGTVGERRRLGYVPQRPTWISEVPATVAEIVATGRLKQRGWWRQPSATDRRAVTHALESVDLLDVADQPINELSGGQQQRAFIARAFASEPELLVLDEPIAGVDAESQRRFRDSLMHLIDEHGAGVLLVSHELSAVAHDVDRVVVLKGRVVFDGSPGELAASGVSLGIHPEDLPLWLEGLR